MNTPLHAICDSRGRPLNLFVAAGQVSDYIGARALLGSLPNVEWPLAERQIGCDDDRGALAELAYQVEQLLCAGSGERQVGTINRLSGLKLELDHLWHHFTLPF